MKTALRWSVVTAAVVLLTGGAFAYYRYSVGVIDPIEIYPEALGLTREQVEHHLGKPREVVDFGNGILEAFWQGREPYSWVYSVWFIRDVAVHVAMPNDLVGLEIQDVKNRVGPAINWQVGSILHHDERFQAVMNEDRSVVIYDTGLGYNVASKDSIFWSRLPGE